LRIKFTPYVAKVAFSPNGKWLAVATSEEKNVVSVRDLLTGKEACAIPILPPARPKTLPILGRSAQSGFLDEGVQ
jgi:WD40 repeat protein